ncbi:MAG: hypothetical protein ACRDJ1_04280 [Actinomycetota bacterium]
MAKHSTVAKTVRDYNFTAGDGRKREAYFFEDGTVQVSLEADGDGKPFIEVFKDAECDMWVVEVRPRGRKGK